MANLWDILSRADLEKRLMTWGKQAQGGDTRTFQQYDKNNATAQRQIGTAGIGAFLPNNPYKEEAQQKVLTQVSDYLTDPTNFVGSIGRQIPKGKITSINYLNSGDMIPVIKNPTRAEADGFFGHAVDYSEKRGVPFDKRDDVIRWIKDDTNGDIYMAPAPWVTHHDLADSLEITKLQQGMVKNPNTFNYLLPE